MYRFTLVVCLLAFSGYGGLWANAAPPPGEDLRDTLILYNQMRFIGEIERVRNCELRFRATDGKRYHIPAADISYFGLDAARPQTQKKRIALEPCLRGQADAKRYYRPGWKYLLLGFLGGFLPLGLYWLGPLVAALSEPLPFDSRETLENADSEFFDDPLYLNCYSRKARGKNVVASLVGTGLGIAAFLSIYLLLIFSL